MRAPFQCEGRISTKMRTSRPKKYEDFRRKSEANRAQRESE